MNTKIGKFDLGSSDKVAHTGAQLGVARLEATPLGYSFWLKGTPTEIRVVLSVNGEQGGFNFHTSHVITQTAGGVTMQATPCIWP
jgi:hypothetical protein